MLSTVEQRHVMDLTQQQLDQVQQMHALLQAEHRALKAGESQLITGIANEKVALLTVLEDLERSRTAWLLKRYPDLNVYDRRALLKVVAPEVRREFALQLARLLKLLQACRRQNQVNGAIAVASRQFTERTLSVLRGQPPQDVSQPLYGRRGESVSQEASSAVASA